MDKQLEQHLQSLDAQIAGLAARIDLLGALPDAEIRSRLKALEQSMTVVLGQDSDAVAHVRKLNTAMAQLQRRLSTHVAPSKKLPGYTEREAAVVELIADASGVVAKRERAELQAEINEAKSTVAAALAGMEASAVQMRALAAAHVHSAAGTLQQAARAFATGTGTKAIGPINPANPIERILAGEQS